VDEDSTIRNAFVGAAGWGGPNIWFTQVPEAKNRMHFDLRAPARWRLGSQAGGTRRNLSWSATIITVMADPEGNEFCVEPGPASTNKES
jgi:Glyoxalase-like domain